MQVLISGVSGFVGSALKQALEQRGHSTRGISRRPGADHDWSNASLERGVAWADAVVHLAGENIFAKRWDPVFKQELWRSRYESTRQLAQLIAKRPNCVWVNASAVGIYGDRGSEELDESSPIGTGFLAELARDWEQACDPARQAGVRLSIARIGLVLGVEGGALERMLPLFRWGLGGRLGSGKQWMSWIGLSDLVAMLIWMLEQKHAQGVYNATAPHPVTNLEFTRTLGRVLHRPTLFPAPAWALRLALGEAAHVLVEGRRALPKRALADGYAFRELELEGCLRQLL